MTQSFEQLYLKRLERWQWGDHGLPKSGPWRKVILVNGNSFYTEEIETMAFDLALVSAGDVEPILEYIRYAGVNVTRFSHLPCRVREKYGDKEFGRFSWYNRYPVNGFVFENRGDQMILKFDFPELC